MNMKIQSELFFTPFPGERGRSLNYFFPLSKKSSIRLAWQWHRISPQLFQRALQTTELSVWETRVYTSTLWRIMWVNLHSLRWEHVSFNIKLIASIFLIHHSNNDIMAKGENSLLQQIVLLDCRQSRQHLTFYLCWYKALLMGSAKLAKDNSVAKDKRCSVQQNTLTFHEKNIAHSWNAHELHSCPGETLSISTSQLEIILQSVMGSVNCRVTYFLKM